MRRTVKSATSVAGEERAEWGKTERTGSITLARIHFVRTLLNHRIRGAVVRNVLEYFWRADRLDYCCVERKVRH